MGCAVAERVAHSKTGTLIRRAFKVKFYSPKPVPPEARKGYLTSMMVSTQSWKCMSFESIEAVIT